MPEQYLSTDPNALDEYVSTDPNAVDVDAPGFTPSPITAGRVWAGIKPDLGDIPQGVMDILSGVGSAVAHPVQTGKTILGLMDPRPGGLREQVAQGVVAGLPGSGRELLERAVDAPYKTAMDASVLAGGGGAALTKIGTAAKIPGLVKAGATTTRVSQAIDPLRAGAAGIARGGQIARNVVGPSSETLKDWGTGWMRSAMKVSKTIQDSNVDDVARNAAELKIMPNAEGFQKAAAQAKEWKQKANAVKRESYKAGTRLDPERIVHSLDRQTQVASRRNAKPQKITSAMRDSRDQFWDANSKATMVEQPLVSPVQTSTGAGLAQESRGTLSATMEAPSAPLARRTGTGWGAEPPQSAAVPILEPPAATTSGMVPVAPPTGVDTSLRGVESNAGFPVRPQTQAVSKMVEGPRQPVPITVGRSMAMTEELNKQIPFAKTNGMSMLGPLTDANKADDALRRAIKLERERVVPGFDAINAERGKRLAIMKQLQNYTLRREGNLDPIPARALLGGGMATGLAVGGAPMGAVIGGTVVPWAVNSPKFKGDMAIKLFHGDKLLNRAGQAARTGATATTRTGVASDALRQALLDAMNKTTEQP